MKRLAAILLFTLSTQAHATDHGATLAKAALRYYGTPYVWGAETAHGIDCSGLISRALWDIGARTPRFTSWTLKDAGRPVRTVRPGDVLWKTGHVGIVVGVDRRTRKPVVLHASGSARRVVLDTVADFRPLRIRRLF
jgi:cell wall-associated NlpC family hydrolase